MAQNQEKKIVFAQNHLVLQDAKEGHQVLFLHTPTIQPFEQQRREYDENDAISAIGVDHLNVSGSTKRITKIIADNAELIASNLIEEYDRLNSSSERYDSLESDHK